MSSVPAAAMTFPLLDWIYALGCRSVDTSDRTPSGISAIRNASIASWVGLSAKRGATLR